jgi:23S rRNA pseudouridine1911/1915/1917 synthase
MKCPILGDLKYGFPQANSDGNISLHAREIFFTHPVSNKMIKITAPLPQNKEWGLLPRKF